MLIGAQVAGMVFNSYLTPGETNLSLADWYSFWWLPAGFAVFVMVIFILFFNEKLRATPGDKGVGEPQVTAGIAMEPQP